MAKEIKLKKQIKDTDFAVYALMKLGQDRWSTIREVADVLQSEKVSGISQSIKGLYVVGAISKRTLDDGSHQYKPSFSSVHIVESLARMACLKVSKKKMAGALFEYIEKFKSKEENENAHNA